jgi:catechol 2,3-dioxygenase-like lactoylglutathione lyase family enzyme
MFSHIMIGANDIQESKAFYDVVLGTLGHAPGVIDDKGRCFYFTDTGIFALTKPINDQPATAMASPSASQRQTRQRPMPGMRRAWPMAAPPAKSLRAYVKALRVNFTSPIYSTRRATKFAR